MKDFIPLVFLGALLLGLPLNGQNLQPCSTPPPQKALVFDHQTNDNLQGAPPYVFRIFVHILRDDDGTNAAMSDATLKTNLDRMAGFYRPHNICFTLVGRDFIDNTTWNTNYTKTLIGALHAVNPHTDAIDIYVHKNGFDSSGGNSYDIPSSKCSVAASASFNFEHEIGHCLGLLHTFETANGTECPDGSNCGSAGDLVCDTPADFSGSENSNSGCSYTGTQMINCNGSSFSYTPPTSNIMSYWAGCYSNFTAGQATRMYNTINSTSFLQDRFTPVDRVIAGTTLTAEIAVGAQNSIRIGNIAALGDVAMNGNAHGIFNAGAFVQAVPGTRIMPSGSNEILLTINTRCDGVSFTGNLPNQDRQAASYPVTESGELEVYPNPFTDKLSVQVSLSKVGATSIYLLDFAGRLIKSIDCQNLIKTGNLSEELELPEIGPGIYFLRFQHAGHLQVVKLVKME